MHDTHASCCHPDLSDARLVTRLAPACMLSQGHDMERSPHGSPLRGTSVHGGFTDDKEKSRAPQTLNELLSREHRKTLRELAEQMRLSGALKVKAHWEQLSNHEDTFKGECASCTCIALGMFWHDSWVRRSAN